MDDGRVQRGYFRNERNDGDIGCGTLADGARVLGQDVVDAEGLRGEDAVERGEAKVSLAVDEIGNMRRTQAGLLSEKRSC